MPVRRTLKGRLVLKASTGRRRSHERLVSSDDPRVEATARLLCGGDGMSEALWPLYADIARTWLAEFDEATRAPDQDTRTH